MRTYTFKFQDAENTVTHVFDTENECWPVAAAKFFEFLKGCGFVFDINDELGVLDQSTDTFRAGEYE